jgi:aminoglycoside phosphotransferase (APT) family kinase protein
MLTPDHERILKQFGLSESDLLGEGGESLVFSVTADTVLRLPRAKAFDAQSRVRLRTFQGEIAGKLPFATPHIEEIGPGETWTIERRLPGRPMTEVLAGIDDDRRDNVLRNYVDAMEAISAIELPTLPYGHLLATSRVNTDDWRKFAGETLARFRARNRVAIASEVGDPYRLFEKATDMIPLLPERPPKVLVHGDFFPGNVLLNDDLSVSAVIDFGTYTVCGDAQLEQAVSYLTLELIDQCTAEDARFVRDMIIERHGAEILPALQFYRAYLAFSMADPSLAAPPYPRLYEWAIAMLKLLAADKLPI